MDFWNALAGIPLPLLFALIVFLVFLTVYMIYEHAKMKGLDGIRAETYQLILTAEHMYRESGAGRQKLKYVVGRARGLLPGWLQFWLTEDFLMDLIDIWFLEVKDLLDDGKINESSEPPKEETSGADVSPEEQTENE